MPKRRLSKAQTEAALSGLDPDATQRLRSIVERIERLEEERKALGDDIKDVFAEAKSAGFDTKVLKEVIRIRRQDRAEAEETQTLRDLYLAALNG
jgi:uncharacterized protein (UPF0335 family)